MDEDMLEKVRGYAARTGHVILEDDLCTGFYDMVVVVTSEVDAGLSVLKFHFREDAYLREREAYLHLRKHGWSSVHGCKIPELLAFDDGERMLKLSFVKPPCVLDLAAAYRRSQFEFPDETWEETFERWREAFGDDWEKALAIWQSFQEIGLYILDLSPSNFCFRKGDRSRPQLLATGPNLSLNL